MQTCPRPGRFDAGRERVPIRPSHGRTPLNEGGGGPHCITEQVPAGTLVSP
jgi:hypothetical protein